MVAVHADGYHVESFVPGGERLKLSGTSMASPNVVNLAAKLFALDPSLTPRQVIALIRQGATPTEDGRRYLIDEKRSVGLLPKRRRSGAARDRAANYPAPPRSLSAQDGAGSITCSPAARRSQSEASSGKARSPS
jgi:subtilisin family serine protease